MRPNQSKRRKRKSKQFHLETLEPRQLLDGHGIVINEIMYHQASDNTDHEFIELYNSGEARSLDGWSFTSGVDFTFPDVQIPADGFLVVAADTAAFQELYPDVTQVVGGWSGRLANRGENIRLVDQLGATIDSVRYADSGDWAVRELGEEDNGHRGWRWLAPHDGDGKSLELQNASLSNDIGLNWQASTTDGGTPGAPNSTQSNDVAPLIANIEQSLIVPTSSDDVTISMQVIDESPDSVSAKLHYRTSETAPFQVLNLTRAGETYSATIPASADRTVVEYFVTATDATGNERTAPAFISDDANRSAHRLYQVLDDAPTVEDWDPQSQPFTFLVMTPSEKEFLRDIGDGPIAESESNARMNGTYIRIDGNSIESRFNIGIRNRGGSSRSSPPNNYRINFANDDRLNGANSLNINALFTHVETVANAIYRLAGLPAPDARPIQTRVNGENLADPFGSMFGSYIETETITGQFPDRYFPEDNRGNLYRVIEAPPETGNLRFEGNNPLAYQDTYSKRTNEEEDDWSDLIDLVNVLNNASEEDFVSEVERVIDVEQWLRYIALDSLLGNQETGLNQGVGNKFYMYRGLEDTRFKLIPHDLDTVLNVGRNGAPNRSVFSNYVEVEGLKRFLSHEEFVPRYFQAFVELMDEVYNPETIFPLMDQLVGYIPDTELVRMKQFVVDRIAGVRAQLPTEFTVSTTLPMVDGYHRTTLPTAEVVGIANSLQTQSVIVNGQPTNWSRATREWSVPIVGDGATETLVPFGSDWKYWDQGGLSSGAWRSQQFNETLWKSGPAPLGYGEGDEGTVVDFGSSPFNRHITTYFRKTFDVEDASQILDLSMRLERDDGAIVYLNGQEVARSNMPSGAVDAQTVASSWIGGGEENQKLSFSIDPSLLVDGVNLLAVEIHQVNSFDDDLRLDLSLEATVGTLTGGVPLNPGINRIQVTAYDGPNGTGQAVDDGFVDVWYDGSGGIDAELCSSIDTHGTPAPAVITSTTLTNDWVMAPCGAAYRVTGDVVIPEGVTLTILPGTTVFFEESTGFTFDGGRLLAEGSELDPIRLTRAPEVTSSWNGIKFNNATDDNRISHAILEHATTEDGMVALRSSRLTIENTTFDNADLIRLSTVDSSLIVRDSVFEDMFEPGEAPASDNRSEHIKGSGILEGGVLLLEGNYFGTTTGHNDSVDFDGATLPGPIPQIINNYFAGSGDDALDLESDAWIVDNTFVNVIKDQFNNAVGDANAISAGAGRTYYAYRNKFHNVDHAVQVKEDAFLEFAYNTVDTVGVSPIYFDRSDVSPGKGANIVSSIFTNTDLTFGAEDQAQELNVTNSIVTAEAVSLGANNFFVPDARLADPANRNFELLPGSPAIGKGFANFDIGGDVPGGVWLKTGPNVTNSRNAQFEVGGPAIVEYRYRLNSGDWSDVRAVNELISLSDLQPGDHQISVSGRTILGLDFSEPTTVSWTIDETRSPIQLSEILASNDSILRNGQTPDLIELYNDSDTSVDLSTFSITDNLDKPKKFEFPAGTTLGSGQYLVLEATDGNGDLQLNFNLDADGEGVFLFADGQLVDSVEFGIQATDLSISRTGADRAWHLSSPTFGFANREIETADPSQLRINEWLASSDHRFNGDFLELYNRDEVPVSLSGLYLTDDPISNPTKHQIAPLSFITGHGFVTFDPNGDPEKAANEFSFGISENGEILALLNRDETPIDQVFLVDQTHDVSQGRMPDGEATVTTTKLATPGRENPVFITTTTSILSFQDTWRFDQTGDDLGTEWRTPDFDDTEWESGNGPFGIINGTTPVPIQTPLDPPRDRGVITHYFRRDFEVNGDLLANNKTVFEMSTMVDDGVIVYINGVEFLRNGLPDGEVTSTTTARRSVGLVAIEGPFAIPTELLREGSNDIYVEVHQVSRQNSDVAFGLELSASVTQTSALYERMIQLQNGLRISEFMYKPAGDLNSEFVELTNISDETLNLRGVSISGEASATFGEVILPPGEFVVLASSEVEFRQQYGVNDRLVGTYTGKLSNSGGELTLHLPAPLDGKFDGTIHRVDYDDAWYPETDGGGRSLEIRDVRGTLNQWTEAGGWKASAVLGGSPGSGTGIGDFNGDNLVDLTDVDLLGSAIANSNQDEIFDLDASSSVDVLDLELLVADLLNTKRGDLDLDGDVDFADFLKLSANFGKIDAVYSDGDVDGNGQVGFGDFLVLSTYFGFDRDNREP